MGMASKGKSSRRKDAGLPKTVTSTNGSISISDIRLPLKREFLDHIVKGAGGKVHYFLVLVKYRGSVIPTQMLSTDEDGILQDEMLQFPNLINLHDLDYTFEVMVEVY